MRRLGSWLAATLTAAIVLSGCGTGRGQSAGMPEGPHVMAGTWEQAGKYLVQVAGCNDCHTANFLVSEGDIPESDWLTGSPVGWQGAWGTTYAANLRRFVRDTPEEVFLIVARTRAQRPPMPWWGLREMSDHDLRAIYRYIASLPVKEDAMPAFVPPNGTPTTPVLSLVPRLPDGTELTGPRGAEGVRR